MTETDVWQPSQTTRTSIRDGAAELTKVRDIPPERFPGHKPTYCANLEGWLGGFTLGLLNALEAVESERDRLRETADAVLEALERVESVAEAGDMEDLNTACHDLAELSRPVIDQSNAR